MQSNELLRNVFELGPPLVLDEAALKTMKIPRFERVSSITCFLKKSLLQFSTYLGYLTLAQTTLAACSALLNVG